MVKIEPQILGKKDERLEYLLQQVKEGIAVFTEAIRNSSDEQHVVGFKAFTLLTDRKEEADAIFDIIMSAVAIELKEQAEDLITKFTFFHQHEVKEEEKEHYLFLYCRKVAPPTKEEIDKRVEEEEKANAKVVEIEETKEETKEDEVLPHASGMHAYRRTGSE
jgi:hypothetical protein